MSAPVRGIATRMGWKRQKSGDRFYAVIEFPDGAPKWPIETVWRQLPILLDLQEPTAPAAHSAGDHSPERK